MFCQKCGKKQDLDNKFCVQCGYNLEEQKSQDTHSHINNRNIADKIKTKLKEVRQEINLHIKNKTAAKKTDKKIKLRDLILSKSNNGKASLTANGIMLILVGIFLSASLILLFVITVPILWDNVGSDIAGSYVTESAYHSIPEVRRTEVEISKRNKFTITVEDPRIGMVSTSSYPLIESELYIISAFTVYIPDDSKDRNFEVRIPEESYLKFTDIQEGMDNLSNQTNLKMTKKNNEVILSGKYSPLEIDDHPLPRTLERFNLHPETIIEPGDDPDLIHIDGTYAYDFYKVGQW